MKLNSGKMFYTLRRRSFVMLYAGGDKFEVVVDGGKGKSLSMQYKSYNKCDLTIKRRKIGKRFSCRRLKTIRRRTYLRLVSFE